MTATLITTAHADPTDDLIQVADGVGVFIAQDLTSTEVELQVNYTKRRAVELDETGGLERLREILETKTGANEVVVVEPSTVERRTTRALRALKAWAKRAVSAVKATLSWLAEPIVEYAKRWRARRETPAYAGRHRVRTSWYGAQRSTLHQVAARRRNAARRANDSEPALPEYWVSHIARCIEAIRGHEDVLHPQAGYQFRC